MIASTTHLGLRLLVFGMGIALVVEALRAALRTFVLPRSTADPVVRQLFLALRRVFDWRLRRLAGYAERDALMAMYAPTGLLLLLPALLSLVLLGHAAMFWALSGQALLDLAAWQRAFLLSGSSLLTLGFERGQGTAELLLCFSAAALGMTLVALLIAYLPSIYTAFAARERMVSLLEVRAGSPPSAVELLSRYQRLGRLDSLAELWPAWEAWFAEIQESHSSLAALVFFRSPLPEHSWVTAAGAVLDSAALAESTLDRPGEVYARMCLRAGFLALRRVADVFRVAYNRDPRFGQDPISISRADFDAACASLAAAGLPLKADRDQAWLDFAGWRVNYDMVLGALCRITMAPQAPWAPGPSTGVVAGAGSSAAGSSAPDASAHGPSEAPSPHTESSASAMADSSPLATGETA